jgi:beta-1,4-N-acetylglucosaminyltransferase
MVAVLGSGGHTAEMMSLLRNVDPRRYNRRTYVVSSGDAFSEERARDIEATIQSKHSQFGVTRAEEADPVMGKWEVKVVPRARKIHQPVWTTPLSSLWCLVCCVSTLRKISLASNGASFEYPDVIITNGPATAVMVILASLILKFFGFAPLYKMKTIYVESWARVKSLSLSGKILLWMGVCDKFVVQWEGLALKINHDTTSLGGKVLKRMGVSERLITQWEEVFTRFNMQGTRRKVEWSGFLVE